MRVGLDIGSTTIKCVVLNDADEVIFDTYERHGSHITEKAKEILERVHGQLGGRTAWLAISGSAGMGRQTYGMITVKGTEFKCEILSL